MFRAPAEQLCSVEPGPLTYTGARAGVTGSGSAGGVAAGLTADIIQGEDKHPAVRSGGGGPRYGVYRTPHSRPQQLAGGRPGGDAPEWMWSPRGRARPSF